MGSGPINKEICKSNIENHKRTIESYKEDIARMRETLKNPNNKHLKDSYKHRIEERQKQIAWENKCIENWRERMKR